MFEFLKPPHIGLINKYNKQVKNKADRIKVAQQKTVTLYELYKCAETDKNFRDKLLVFCWVNFRSAPGIPFTISPEENLRRDLKQWSITFSNINFINHHFKSDEPQPDFLNSEEPAQKTFLKNQESVFLNIFYVLIFNHPASALQFFNASSQSEVYFSKWNNFEKKITTAKVTSDASDKPHSINPQNGTLRALHKKNHNLFPILHNFYDLRIKNDLLEGGKTNIKFPTNKELLIIDDYLRRSNDKELQQCLELIFEYKDTFYPFESHQDSTTPRKVADHNPSAPSKGSPNGEAEISSDWSESPRTPVKPQWDFSENNNCYEELNAIRANHNKFSNRVIRSSIFVLNAISVGILFPDKVQKYKAYNILYRLFDYGKEIWPKSQWLGSPLASYSSVESPLMSPTTSSSDGQGTQRSQTYSLPSLYLTEIPDKSYKDDNSSKLNVEKHGLNPVGLIVESQVLGSNEGNQSDASSLRSLGCT